MKNLTGRSELFLLDLTGMENLFNYLQFLKEDNINKNLYDSGFFCGDFQTDGGTISKVLSDMGYKLNDMLAGTYLAAIHPEDIGTYNKLIDRFHRGLDDNFLCEYRLKDSSHEWRWILTQSFVIKRNKDNTVHKLIGFDRDITARKRVELFYQDKLVDSRAQLELVKSIQDNDSSEESLPLILDRLKGVIDFTQSEIYIREDHGYKRILQYPPLKGDLITNIHSLLPYIDRELSPTVIDDLPGETDLSLFILPLHISQKLIGFVLLGHKNKDFYKGSDLFPARQFSSYLSLLINSHMVKREQSRIEEKIHREKNLHIARELHDGIAQNLACGKMITEQLRDPHYRRGVEEEDYFRLHNIILGSLREVRALSETIRISSEKKNLSDLLERYCLKMKNYFDLTLSFEDNTTKDFPLSAKDSEHILRIVQEGFSNAQRHSESTKVKLILSQSRKEITLKICDRGTASLPFKEGLGMKGMKERASLLGGNLHWEQKDGNILVLHLPESLFEKE
ncbi:MAG: PAS domain-containing protein [Spirochaetales bacterium]|nr:PAS domain-containing protein [Spirochaetales bacterium]